MDGGDLIGVAISKDVELKIRWGDLGKTLTKVALNGLSAAIGLTTGLSGAISSLGGGVDAIKLKDDPGYQAWQLFMLSFAWALDQLRQDPDTDATEIRAAFRLFVDKARATVNAETAIVPRSFLERPTTLPVYRVIRDELVDQRSIFRSKTVETAESLRVRFDAAFERGVFEIWSRRRDVFQALGDALDAPGLVAAESRLQWETYRKRLVYDFEVSPVFGQEITKISLSQLYVPLRGTWRNESSEPRVMGEGIEVHSEGDESRVLIDLDSALDSWVSSDTPDEMRLIGGGPGSGKSTALKALASRQAQSQVIRPLLVPLQHISLDGDLREQINQYFTGRSDNPFTHPPLERQSVEDGPPLLLIFDGLDEIARPGVGADEIATVFVSKLNYLIGALKGDRLRKVRVVLSGRMASFQAVSKHLSIPDFARIEVHGFAPMQGDSRHPLAILDQRPFWWKQYAAIAGLDVATPPAFRDTRLRDITREPLLCYLLVLSDFAIGNWEAAAKNQNRIFEKLVNEVWERRWGEGTEISKRQGSAKSLTKSDFNRLMETIALAAWLGGDTKVCSESGFEDALQLTQCKEPWENFRREGGADVSTLAMNFYLKATDKSLRGFEFTHKSFGDYLAARAILRIAREVSDLVPRRTHVAIQDWIRASATGELSEEILRFMRDEMRMCADQGEGVDLAERIKRAFEVIENSVLHDGFPIQVSDSLSWRSCETRQRNAEAMIWAVLHSTFSAVPASKPISDRRIRIEWPEKYRSAKALVLRMSTPLSRSAFGSCLVGVNFAGCDFFGCNLSYVNLAEADLRDCNFSACYLGGVIFRNADLRGARFIRANLSHSDFAGARLGGVVFNNSILSGSRVFFKTRGKFFVNKIALCTLDPPTLRDIVRGPKKKRLAIGKRFNSDDERFFSTTAGIVLNELAPLLPVEEEGP
jgi:hypothetical protein